MMILLCGVGVQGESDPIRLVSLICFHYYLAAPYPVSQFMVVGAEHIRMAVGAICGDQLII